MKTNSFWPPALRIAIYAPLLVLGSPYAAAHGVPQHVAAISGGTGGHLAARPTAGVASRPCDILIVGAGTGGTAAALAAAQNNASVCLLQETDWVGGQLTEQGVSTPDDHDNIEVFGGTRRYYQFRRKVRDYYRTHYQLKEAARHDLQMSPGTCWVGKFGFEPKVGDAVLREMLAPYIQSGRLHVFQNVQVKSIVMDSSGARILRVVAAGADGARVAFTPRLVLDATETSDLITKAGREGVDWSVGAEARAQTGEPDAPTIAHREWVQPVTVAVALTWSPETASTNIIPAPPNYAAIKRQQSFSAVDGIMTGVMTGAMPFWSYRRILSASNFRDPRVQRDVVLVNTDSNDYKGEDGLKIVTGSREEAREVVEKARRVSLAYVHWLQTECPRDSDPTKRKRGYPEFRIKKEVFGTQDGTAPVPYYRESRRIMALRTIKEQEIVAADRNGRVWQPNARAAFMNDSVGLGYYPLDVHKANGDAGGMTNTRPFQIPLGAMIPARLDNLLPACKNIGVTHLTNGAYRLHPVEWNIGEAAGVLAAFCTEHGRSPRYIPAHQEALWLLQRRALEEGIPLYWFLDVPLENKAFAAVEFLAERGVTQGDAEHLYFHPNAPVAAAQWALWRHAAGGGPARFAGTRQQAALLLYREMVSPGSSSSLPSAPRVARRRTHRRAGLSN